MTDIKYVHVERINDYDVAFDIHEVPEETLTTVQIPECMYNLWVEYSEIMYDMEKHIQSLLCYTQIDYLARVEEREQERYRAAAKESNWNVLKRAGLESHYEPKKKQTV